MTQPMCSLEPVPDPPQPPSTRGIVLERAAAVYDLLLPVVTLWQTAKLNRQTAAFLSPQPADRVLDIGCATGGMTLAVAELLDDRRGGLSVGLDASPRMIARARKKAGQLPCRFDIGLAEKLPYGDRVFDKAVSTFFFHHLNIQDKLAALREVHRVLNKGGLFVLVDVDVPTTLFGRLCARSGQWLFRQPEIGENIDGKLPALFEPAGFTRVTRLAHYMGYVTAFALRKQ